MDEYDDAAAAAGAADSGANSTVKVIPGPNPGGMIISLSLPSGALTRMVCPDSTPCGSVTRINFPPGPPCCGLDDPSGCTSVNALPPP